MAREALFNLPSRCNHTCKDKFKCRHYCCKEGLADPPRSHRKDAQTEPPLERKESMKRNHRKIVQSCFTEQNYEEPSRQRNEASGRLQSRIPKKGATERKRRFFPNFDLELASLRSNSPICDSKAIGGDDDELESISEILNRDRSRKPETNNADAVIGQAHIDSQPPESGQEAGMIEVRKDKRPRKTPSNENEAPARKHRRTIEYPQEEKSTFAPLINKSLESHTTPLFFTSSPGTGYAVPSQISETSCDRPSTPAQTAAYEEFYLDDTCFDDLSTSAWETFSDYSRATDASKEHPGHQTPQRGRRGSRKEKEANSYASVELNAEYQIKEPTNPPTFEQLPVSRISGFIARAIHDGFNSRKLSQEWSDNRSRKGNLPAPLPSSSSVQICSDADTNTTDDPLAEFNCWLASGAVDIVE